MKTRCNQIDIYIFFFKKEGSGVMEGSVEDASLDSGYDSKPGEKRGA